MSKRGMETQGGEERYGSMANERDAPDDKPKAATSAQMARRKIIQAKGRASARPSRQASPAIAGQAQANPFQSFQPPPSASGFNFSMPGSTPSPAFAQAALPPPQNGAFGSPAPEQANGTPSFGGFSNTQNNATPSFGSGFGSTNSQPQQSSFNPTPSFQTQPNGTTTTPGTSFNFGQTQSQEQPKPNGFKPSTFSFGGPPSQPTNGATPSFSFGQSQQQEQQTPKPSTPSFGGFGQTAQPNGNKPAATGLFGSTAAADAAPKTGESIFSGLSGATNGIKPGMFTSQQAHTNGEQTLKPSNPFAGLNFGQQNKEKEQEPPKSTFSWDQNKQNGDSAQKPLFSLGQQHQQNGEQTPKPSFAGFGQQPQTDGEQTPKPSNPFSGISFGQQEQTPAEKPAEKEGQQKEAEKPSSPFKFGQTQDEETTKPAGNLFSGLGGSQPTGTSAFRFGASQQEDTSMMSPDSTPHKQSAGQAASEPAAPTETSAASEPETPAHADAGKSLFDRISHAPPATAPRPSFSFGGAAALQSEQDGAPGKSLFERLTPREPEAPATAPKPSMMPFGMPAASSAPQPPLFNATPASRASTQPAQHSLSSTFNTTATNTDGAKLKELNEGMLAHLRTEDPGKDWSVIFQYYMGQAAKLTGKDAFKARTPAPAAQPAAPPTNAFGSASGSNVSPIKPTAPPAGMFQAQAPAPPGHSSYASTSKTPAAPSVTNMFSQFSKQPATAPANKKRSADEDLKKGSATPEQPATEKRARPSEPVHYPRLPETASRTAQLFASTLDKPVDTPINHLGPPDHTYNEVQKQKAAKEAAQKGEAEKLAPPPSAFKPSTTFKFGAAAPETEKSMETPKAPAFGFMPSTPAAEKPAEASKAPTFGFTPSTSTTAASATGGFKPTFTAPAGGSANFLSSFGKKAESEEEKARKKRMDEDYDSDDEDKASWEARDRVAQEAKKRRIEEAAKSAPVFSLPPGTSDKPASSAPFAFKLPTTENTAEPEKPASSNAGKSLFERLTPATNGTDKAPASSSQPSIFSTQTPAKSTFGSKTAFTPSSGFNFGQSKPSTTITNQNGDIDKLQAEKPQGGGNNTWRPSTPIKFSAPTGNESTTPAAPPPSNPFAGLFGSSATPASKSAGSEPGKLAPPSIGFSFGAPNGPSTDISRATTPGLTTDGETSTAGDRAGDEGEPSEQQGEKQIDDMAALLPEEREAEDVLFQVEMAKATKLDERKTEDGYVRAWVEKGKGPLYIVKNKTTGRTRILLKIPPLGRSAMNFGPVQGTDYENVPGKRIVRGTFFDHLDTNKEKAGRPSSWTVQVREPSDAAEMARILNEEKDVQ
ncbi:hypothetical protein LTR36_006130 [Oleoguttula mirabilis]|uniref:RanBD1 domain-containing protein n=1 Tax=Oleoguttula mirabilis TaxID=1507867 RepID=A0AAV9JD30_9PEZI|nr:hypothetical protein LTR36_006130 [Oleoguttula mirabilis]